MLFNGGSTTNAGEQEVITEMKFDKRGRGRIHQGQGRPSRSPDKGATHALVVSHLLQWESHSRMMLSKHYRLLRQDISSGLS